MRGRRFLFWFGIVFLVTVPLVVGLCFQSPQMAWLATLIGAFVTLLSRFDELSELALGPLRAKLRRAVREAAASVEQLRELAAVIANASLTQLIAEEFMDGMSLAERMRIRERIVGTLESLGIDSDRLKGVEEQWSKGISIVYFRAIRTAIEGRRTMSDQRGASELSPEIRVASEDFQKLLRFEDWYVPPPDELEQFTRKRDVFNSAVAEWIADYRYFLSKGRIRRPDLFAQQ